MIHIEHFTFNAFQTRCSIVWDDDKLCAFVDPGCATAEETSALTEFVREHDLKPVCIMLTHAHFDHIYGMSALAKEYDIPVYAHKEEMFTIETTNPQVCRFYGLPLADPYPIVKSNDQASLPGRFVTVSDGDTINVGSLHFNVLETPGHSRGGLCFLELDEHVLFSGDTLFAGAIGRTDHAGGDYDRLMRSIFEKLMSLEGSVTVIPGHGPCSDIATERTTNPFLQPFNEPFEE